METQVFRIQPPSRAMIRETAIILGLLITCIGAPFFFFPYADEEKMSFGVSIASLAIIYIIALVYLSLCVGWFTDYYTTGQKTLFEVNKKALTIHQDEQSTSYELKDLHIDQIRVINLKKKPEYRPILSAAYIPSWRIVALFYNAGEFKLRNGDTAQICLTDARLVVHIPTKLDYALLLSPTDPNGLLLALIRAADPPKRNF